MNTTPVPGPLAIELSVGGMTCQGCVANITRGLGKLDGVAEVNVNLTTKRATIRPDGSVELGILEDAARQAITGLGYQVLTQGRPMETHDHHHGMPVGSGMRMGDGKSTGSAMGRTGEHAAHLASESARVSDLWRRLAFAALLATPLAALSMVEAWHFAGWRWAAAALATPVYLWSAWPFHRSALKSARHGATNMDTLVSMGATAAWVWSMIVLVGGAAGVDTLGRGHVYFETGAVIVTLILVGKWLEARSTARASDAIRALSRLQVDTVRLEDGREIPLSSLEVGSRFVTRPGEAVATDGRVVDGEAAVDASMVTGESVPIHKGKGDEVIGGTIATDGALTVEATRIGSDTLLAQVTRMVDEAQSRKADVQRLADRVSAVFVPAVIVLAVVTLCSWLVVSGDVNRAFTATVAVLIISCPCALGLATPLAIMVGTGRGAQLGILIRGGQVLENVRKVGVVVLDKTGTVTEGKMSVSAVHAPGLDDGTRSELIVAAASAEERSEHPIGQAIARATNERREVSGFRAIPGQGVTATVEGKGRVPSTVVWVGSRRLFDEIPRDLTQKANRAETSGATAVFAGRVPVPDRDTMIPVQSLAIAEAVIEVKDTVKEGAADAVAEMRRLGLDVVLLTGDNERSARAVAAEVGIEDVRAEVLPGDKAEVVRMLQGGGKRVAMVGDGVNDAPALAQADLGIALGTGADVAREASDLTVVSGDPRAAVDAIRLSRRVYSTILGNLTWAFGYNVAAIPLAALGLLNPMIASAAMGSSSLFVVGNSLRLRRFRPRR